MLAQVLLGLPFRPDGLVAYVINRASNNVSVINTASESVTNTIPVGTPPFDVAFSPDGSIAYVPIPANGVAVIDTVSETCHR